MHRRSEVHGYVNISALPPGRHRLVRFLFRPVHCLVAAQGRGRRVLILHDVELLWWAPLVRLFTGARVIYDVHEDFAQLMRRRTWIPGPLRALVSGGLLLLERACAACCDGVIGVTQTLVDNFRHRRRLALYNLPSLAFIRQAG